jgi:transcriptional regulator with XRE-family HTH domain
MTFRHQIRVGSRLYRGRSPIDAVPPPSLGETLQAAREQKGVDLHRAERDTKIRAKHLAALESGDYSELPGPVYTRGFLKNYATYLGLDADELVMEWQLEQQAAAPRIPQVIAIPPQPLIEPKGHLRFTRGIFIGALLIVVIVGFLGYVGLQLLRFSHPPVVTLSAPNVQTLDQSATSYSLSGTVDLPYALISVTGPDGFLQTTDANSLGGWSMNVPVTKGRNDFAITARDPQLPPDKGSTPVNVILTVPIGGSPPPASLPSVQPDKSNPPPTQQTHPTQPSAPTPTPNPDIPAAEISFASPREGDEVQPGTVTVTGATNASAVSIAVRWGGPVDPAQSPAPTQPPDQPPVEASVAGGSFTANVPLQDGRWVLTATTQEQPGVLASASYSITVNVVEAGDVVVTVRVTDSNTRIKVIADGQIVEQGRVFRRRESETYSASDQITVITSNAGQTEIVYNGKITGPGPEGQSQSWRFEKGKPPKKL